MPQIQLRYGRSCIPFDFDAERFDVLAPSAESHPLSDVEMGERLGCDPDVVDVAGLAHDIGHALGVGAYLEELVRTRHGPFKVDEATTLEGLAEAFRQETWRESLFPPEFILWGWPVHTATPEEEADVRQGKPLRAPGPISRSDRRMMAVKTEAGDILAVAEWSVERGLWQPKKVFPAGEQHTQR